MTTRKYANPQAYVDAMVKAGHWHKAEVFRTFESEKRELVPNEQNPNLMDIGIFTTYHMCVKVQYKPRGRWSENVVYFDDELTNREQRGEWWDRR
jgi:hypothetical protein